MRNMKRLAKRQSEATWPQDPSIPTTRMYADEREAFLRLQAMVFMAEHDLAALEKRARAVPGLYRDLRMMAGLPRRILDRLALTITPEQGASLNMQLDNLAYTIGVAKAGKTGNLTDYGVWMSWQDFDDITEAAKAQCLTCIKDPGEEKQCKLRKALDKIGSSLTHEGGCGFKMI